MTVPDDVYEAALNCVAFGNNVDSSFAEKIERFAKRELAGQSLPPEVWSDMRMLGCSIMKLDRRKKVPRG